MVQQVLDLPKLKIAKPSDTRWLAHKRCVKARVTALNDIHENTHEPEAHCNPHTHAFHIVVFAGVSKTLI